MPRYDFFLPHWQSIFLKDATPTDYKATSSARALTMGGSGASMVLRCHGLQLQPDPLFFVLS